MPACPRPSINPVRTGRTRHRLLHLKKWTGRVVGTVLVLQVETKWEVYGTERTHTTWEDARLGDVTEGAVVLG